MIRSTERMAALIIGAGMVLGLAACEGVEGDPGEFKVRVAYDTTVTSMTLTGIDIPVSNALPNSSKSYHVEELKGTIYWTVNTPSVIDFFIKVKKKPKQGEDGSSGLLPYAEGFELAPITATKGEQGEDTNYIFFVTGGTFMSLYSRTVVAGTPF